jgi:hypothetical protein
MAFHLAGEPNLAEERNETGQAAEGRNGLGRFIQNQLGIAEERAKVRRGRFVQGRVGSGGLIINPYAQNPFLKATLFRLRSSG